eukprot:CAMPEP_0170525128 /NCGR_PEP_ID=MMETSP0209-20121228/10587_1 /TAXON_ID=665100 ORGANISM="Litonotus pictus, Strain P1" /NCGR_SAMPLE_ID=MMETSP0209 /ASSEMBLY_ACC=CAM_ASM_000301 /LENGTH=281 /DNA_ID=CAMNT_0010814213 /DNA_START=1816 /DNA_END=2658 /DNA_ORIENTATION=+
MIKENLVEDFSYMTPKLSTLCNSKTELKNMGKALAYGLDVYGVSANFYKSTANQFLDISDSGYHEEIKDDTSPSEWLYAVENDGYIGMSAFFTDQISMDIDTKFLIFNSNSDNNEFMQFLFKPAFLLSSSPAINFSTMTNPGRKRSTIVPMNIYADMLAKCSNYFYENDQLKPVNIPYEDIPLYEIFIKPKNDDKDTTERIDEILSVDENFVVRIRIAAEMREELNKTRSFISTMFYFVALIILIFCFFNLTASMSINMYEQHKEISIFRSLGLTSSYLKW